MGLSIHTMTSIVAPMCMACTRYHRDDGRMWFRCDAYPEGIPQGIIESQVDHRKPYVGDHDLQFQQVRGLPVPPTFQMFDHPEIFTRAGERGRTPR